MLNDKTRKNEDTDKHNRQVSGHTGSCRYTRGRLPEERMGREGTA
jgi:hypothetical protein